MSDCPNRKELLEYITNVSFAVDDVKLFLDTHPCDEEALAYFREYSRKRNEALKEYAAHFGPLTIDTVVYSCADNWDWINEPWPWQEGGC
jgi:spore coat protein JB